MDLLQVFMRLLHIGLGVFWAGTVFFNAIFLLPSLRDAGPDGAKVQAALMRRGFMTALPIAAALTILSGLWLYWRASVGFQPAYMGSSVGITYGIGALAAIVALGLGIAIVRPSMLKAVALTQRAATAPAGERDAALAQAQALRVRVGQVNTIVTLLVAVAVVAMAVGRYV